MSAFPEIQKFIDERDFTNVISWCQEKELKSSDKPENFKKYWGVYLISLLIKNDVVGARFLWHRIPSEVRSDQHLKSIWSLLKYISQLSYPHIYKSLSLNYGTDLTPIIAILKETFQNRTFELISNSYTNISIKDCSTYLGISPDDTVTFTQSNGWTKDANSDSLKPVPIKSKPVVVKSPNHQINSLANFVLFLEK